MNEFVGYIFSGISEGSVYSLIALGFVLIVKCSGIYNMAQGELVIVGAYIFYSFSSWLGWPIWVSLLATFLFATLLGFTIERFAIRPLLGQPHLSLIMVTLVVGGLLQGIMALVWGHETLSLPRLFPTGGVDLAGTVLSYEYVAFFLASVVIVGILLLFFRYSKTGVEMMAMSDNAEVAQSVGINVKAVLTLSWIIACWVASIGGILMTSVMGVHYAAAGIGLRSLAVALVGGLESLGGVMIAGPLVGVVEVIAAVYLDPLVGGGFRLVAAYIMMIIVLLFRPYGLFGWKKIERV